MITETVAPHIPVLLEEAIEALKVKPGGRYIDCTVGGGGHARLILEKSCPDGLLLGLDADPDAIAIASRRLRDLNPLLVRENFSRLKEVAQKHDFYAVDGILFDLGISSLQLGDARRGFSFQRDSPLDMRFDPRLPTIAADLVNTLSERELAHLFFTYGEERRSRRIARTIVENRPIHTTSRLAQLAIDALGLSPGRIHPATKIFLALRIATNKELEHLRTALEQAVDLLGHQGRLVVISFHSLEDRIVKGFFQRESKGCLCLPAVYPCTCGHIPTLRIITRKPVRPGLSDMELNPRARSAKMRVAEKI
ncbi:MAG: 16S rRNA (cytosine(1402)-N(4))-methyltransferase RsmH [Chloroflexi bacterium]|nr:16S rRNA (cytosine(1402)-N(4))-methyltransferase RsmH [Chloroflexota bacterium]